MVHGSRALSDSDFATDKDSRRSVTGFVVYFLGVPISWRSREMRSVVLSTTEAEYVSVSEVVKELRFIIQVLQSMEISVELPIQVQCDNVGAIWLANNQTTSDRTKHVDVKYHFIQEFIEDGTVKIVFDRSKENNADIFTNILTGELYDIHGSKLVWDTSNVEGASESDITGRVLEDSVD